MLAKRFVTLVAVLVLFPIVTFAAGSAEEEAAFPQEPIEIIVPWGEGGNADQQARIVARTARDILGVPVTVRNMPGGATIPGVMEALNAEPDGYTLIWTAIPSVATVPLIQDPPYDKDDLYPLGNVSQNTLVLYVREESEYQSVEDVVNAARDESMSMAVNATGALPHLAAAGLAQRSGATFDFITEGDSVSAVVSLMGGHVEAALAHEPQAFSHGDDIRPLAVFEPERSRLLPEVPTVEEELGYELYGYVRDSIAINAEAPDQVKRILVDAFDEAINSDEVVQEFEERRIKHLYLSPEETLELWNEAEAAYRDIIDNLEN